MKYYPILNSLSFLDNSYLRFISDIDFSVTLVTRDQYDLYVLNAILRLKHTYVFLLHAGA